MWHIYKWQNKFSKLHFLITMCQMSHTTSLMWTKVSLCWAPKQYGDRLIMKTKSKQVWYSYHKDIIFIMGIPYLIRLSSYWNGVDRTGTVVARVRRTGSVTAQVETGFVNTLRLRKIGCHFPDDIFKWIFFNENIWISIKDSSKFVSKGLINNILALVQIMAWHRPSNYLNQRWLLYWPIYASLGPNESMLMGDKTGVPACVHQTGLP